MPWVPAGKGGDKNNRHPGNIKPVLRLTTGGAVI